MHSVLGNDVSLVFLCQTHWLQSVSFSHKQPSITAQSEVFEVSTSRGRTQPFSTVATAMNSPFLLKMRASSDRPSPGIWLPCRTFRSSVPETSIRGQDCKSWLIGIKSPPETR